MVGVTEVVGELATAYQPVIAVLSSGRTLGARAVALSAGGVEVDLKLITTQIEGVEPIKLPGHHALTTQAPRLATSVVSTKRVLQKGEALLIASSVTPDERTGRFRCCVVTSKAIQPVKLAAVGSRAATRR